jgi:hypothetical protein
MTTENQHYCQEHQCPFVLRVGKYGGFYSHPLEGGGFCKETKKDKPKEQSKPESVFKVEPEKREYPKDETKTFKADPATRVSIELQQAIITVKDLWIAGKLQDGEPEIIGLRQWIRDRLCPNALQGKIEVLKPVASPITKQEVAKALTDKGLLTVEKIRPTELAALKALNDIPKNHEKIAAKVEEMGWGLKGKPLSTISQPQAMILLGLFPDDDNPPVDSGSIPF